MTGIVRSEWLELRSLRSSHYTLAVLLLAVAAAAVLTWQGVRRWEHLDAAQRARFQSPPMEQVFLPLVQACLAVLGALTVPSEYATRTIYPTLVAVPRRLRVLAARTVIVAGVSIIAGTATEIAIYLASRAIIAGRPLPGSTGPLSAELPTPIGIGLSVSVTVVMALELGAAIRSTAATLLGVIALIWVAPSPTPSSAPPRPPRSRPPTRSSRSPSAPPAFFDETPDATAPTKATPVLGVPSKQRKRYRAMRRAPLCLAIAVAAVVVLPRPSPRRSSQQTPSQPI